MPLLPSPAGEARLILTAPWDPILIRRGDALGLRALTDVFAESVAPGTSNRIRDGRWVTILAWCVARSHEVFHACGDLITGTREGQRRRYAWLRPLELMWVARTIELVDDSRDRHLNGQRSVRPWLRGGRLGERFGMTPDQLGAYRHTGMYGGYRVAFRKWPDMTVNGEGWAPAKATADLARWLDGKLGDARPNWSLDASAGTALSSRSAKLGRGQEARWWLSTWKNFAASGRLVDQNTLPRRRDEFALLPEAELLRPVVFSRDPAGHRRRESALRIVGSSAENHLGLCRELSRAFADDPVARYLPLFSRLADAGMEAMETIADALRKDSHIALGDVAATGRARAACKELAAAAQAWQAGCNASLRHVETANILAAAIPGPEPLGCLRGLLQHHEARGGGLRWFVLRNGYLEPRAPPGGNAGGYRFRLYSLGRLAVQCGLTRRMPAALSGHDDIEETDE
jgi:hypothetical protein